MHQNYLLFIIFIAKKLNLNHFYNIYKFYISFRLQSIIETMFSSFCPQSQVPEIEHYEKESSSEYDPNEDLEYCEIGMSRVNSNYSIRQLTRLCSASSNYEEETTKKIHQKFYLSEGIFERIEKECNILSQIFEIHSDLVLLLLNKYRWNVEKLNESYFLKQFQQYSAINANLKKLEQQNSLLRKKKEKGEIMVIEQANINICSVCEQHSDAFLYNYCNHGCCSRCWTQHIRISVDNLKGFIRCIQNECKQYLLNSFINGILSKQCRKKYIRNISMEFAKCSKELTLCPAIDCDYYFQDTSLTSKMVVCLCGKRFCFKCGREPHEPCTCVQVDNWYSIIKKENINEVWIKKNTKICPTCKLAVQRSMGCNFINCTCGQKFCYNCSKKWDETHVSHFKCPYSEQKQEIDQTQYKKANKITKNYGSFLLLDAIQKKSEEEFRNINMWRQEFCKKTHLGDSDTIFLSKAYEITYICNGIIKWGEVLQYFKDNLQQRKQLGDFNLNNFKKELEKYSDQIEEVKRKLSLLIDQDRYLLETSRGVHIKEFYTQRESIQKKIKAMEKIMNQYLQQIQT